MISNDATAKLLLEMSLESKSEAKAAQAHINELIRENEALRLEIRDLKRQHRSELKLLRRATQELESQNEELVLAIEQANIKDSQRTQI